jgi:uncharacterized protein YkwD
MLRAFLIGLLLLSGPAFAGAAEDQVLALVNGARAKAGCRALQPNPQLTAAALGQARAMAQQNFFGHTGKTGSTLRSRVRAEGYRYRAAAENIAAGWADAQTVVKGWLGSKGHRKNMLTCRYSETGIAMVYQPEDAPLAGQTYAYKYYWVQVFAAP